MPTTAHAVYLPEDLAIADSPSDEKASASLNDTVIERAPRSVPVFGIQRKIHVKIAQERSDWEQAFELVASNYRARGYESSDARSLRFTRFHALPDTVTFVAKDEGRVIATLSLVLDNTLLGLPMESIYQEEIAALRSQGRQICEVTSLADCNLSLREFMPVFVALMNLLTQYFLKAQANAMLITINPRHRSFYRKVMGFVPFGPWRAYPSVQNHPAEALLLDPDLIKLNAPAMYQKMIVEKVPASVLVAYPMPSHLINSFASRSSLTNSNEVLAMLEEIKTRKCIRRWR
jgi:hypothetical protein